MVYGLFVYTSDDGTDYAVSVPTDVATALSMVPVTTQPYLDDTIAPRWANFRSATGQVRQAVIKNQAQFAGIVGTAISIAGVAYTGSSARGESIGALQPNLIQPPQALMGPPGPPGPGGGGMTLIASSTLATDVTTPGSYTWEDVFTWTLPNDGSYLLLCCAQIEDASGAANNVGLRFNVPTAGTIGGAEMEDLAGNQRRNVSFISQWEGLAGDAVAVQVGANGGAGKAVASGIVVTTPTQFACYQTA